MRETIYTWEAVLLIAEFFCIGGSIFAREGVTKDVLRILWFVFAVIVVVVGW